MEDDKKSKKTEEKEIKEDKKMDKPEVVTDMPKKEEKMEETKSEKSTNPVKKQSNNAPLIIGGILIALIICCICVCFAFFTFGSSYVSEDFQDEIREEIQREFDENNNNNNNSNDSQTRLRESEDSDEMDTPVGESTYVECDNLGSSFLQPAGWSKYEEYNPSFAAETCYVTKEPVGSPLDRFETGLTVIKFEDFSVNNQGAEASVFVDSYLKAIAEGDSVTIAEPVQTITGLGSSVDAKFRFLEAESDGTDSRQYHGVFANDSKDVVYLILFESPIDQFEAEYENNGEEILSGMLLSF